MPETSAKPPSPPSGPPRAEIRPAKSVCRSDHRTTLPPWPASTASARIVVAASTPVVAAVCRVPPPRASPPTRMRPPLRPLASRVAPRSRTASPVTVIEPPSAGPRAAARVRRDAVRAETSSRPETVTPPPGPPPSTIAPDRPPMLRASTMPDRLIADRAASRAVAACISMRPPTALVRPACRISAPAEPSGVEGTLTCRKPSPEKSSVARSPAPSPTLPIGTEIVPAWSTLPPRSAAYPPGWIVIRPSLTTDAEAPPRPENVRLPATKSSSPIPSVEATNPAALTVPVFVIAMPFGLTR